MTLPAFNRVLVRHLAQSLKSGAACDESLVQECYAAAQREVTAAVAPADDALGAEIQSLCIAQDLEVLQKYQEPLARLSTHELESALYRLLNPELRTATNQRKSVVF